MNIIINKNIINCLTINNSVINSALVRVWSSLVDGHRSSLGTVGRAVVFVGLALAHVKSVVAALSSRVDQHFCDIVVFVYNTRVNGTGVDARVVSNVH